MSANISMLSKTVSSLYRYWQILPIAFHRRHWAWVCFKDNSIETVLLWMQKLGFNEYCTLKRGIYYLCLKDWDVSSILCVTLKCGDGPFIFWCTFSNAPIHLFWHYDYKISGPYPLAKIKCSFPLVLKLSLFLVIAKLG